MIIFFSILGVLVLLGAGWYFAVRDYWKEWPGLHDINTEVKNGR
jgi:hypothetical protein